MAKVIVRPYGGGFRFTISVGKGKNKTHVWSEEVASHSRREIADRVGVVAADVLVQMKRPKFVPQVKEG